MVARKHFTPLLLSALVLGACSGSGSDSSPSPATTVPADFSSTAYYELNQLNIGNPALAGDSLALAQHYLDIGQAEGWRYRWPVPSGFSAGSYFWMNNAALSATLEITDSVGLAGNYYMVGQPQGWAYIIPVPGDFLSTGYWMSNPGIQGSYQVNDTLGLAYHYYAYGQIAGLTYGIPVGMSIPVASSIALVSSAGTSIPTGTSSAATSSSATGGTSYTPLSSTPAGTLPAGFRAEEYCYLNSVLKGFFGISNCANLSATQRTDLESYYTTMGAARGHWWNLQTQCAARTNSPTEVPCEYTAAAYWASCNAAPTNACAVAVTDTTALKNHFLTVGRAAGFSYSAVPSDFNAVMYRTINTATVGAIYPTGTTELLGWHYVLFGRAAGLRYNISTSSSSSSDPFADMVKITSEPAFKIVGYMMNGTIGTWNDAYMRKLTHVVVFGPEVNADGSLAVGSSVSLDMLQWWSYWGSKVDTRIMVAIGGWCKSDNFPAMAANPTARANFINQLKSWGTNYFIYGVDIDWEGCDGDWNQPGANVNVLLQEMKAGLGAVGMKVSVAVHATSNPLSGVGAGATDWINVMCYDGGSHATLSLHNQCKTAYSGYASKAVIGVPLYAGVGGSATSYRSGPNTSDASCTSTDACYYNSLPFVGKEGMAYRANDLKNSSYGGIMAWAIEHDTYPDAASLFPSAATAVGYNP